MMLLVQRFRDVKVNLGKWCPVTTTDDPSDRIPRGTLLQKAVFWSDDKYRHVRDVLASPLLQVEVASMEDAMRVDVKGGRSTILVVNQNQGMPSAVSQLEFKAVMIDCRGMTVEETHLFDRMPGRSRFTDVPLILFGGVAEVEEAKRGIMRATQSQWAGQTRVMDVLMNENSPMYSKMRRRLMLMIPDNRPVGKMPPVINLDNARPIVLGWCAIMGLLRDIWRVRPHPVEEEEEQPEVEWLYVVTDDVDMAVLLGMRLDSGPSILHCPLHAVRSLQDHAETVSTHLQGTENVAVIPWDDMTIRWHNCLPLFPDAAPVEDGDDSSDEAERAPPTPVTAPPKPAAPKPKARAKPKPKPEKEKVTRVVKKAKKTAVREEEGAEPSAHPQTPPRAALEAATNSAARDRLSQPAATSSARDRDASRASETEAERDRDRDRQREQERARLRDREREEE